MFYRIVEIRDMCRPYRDIDEIYRENKDNIKGRFIEEANLMDIDEETKEFMLDYGLMALGEGGGDWL